MFTGRFDKKYIENFLYFICQKMLFFVVLFTY